MDEEHPAHPTTRSSPEPAHDHEIVFVDEGVFKREAQRSPIAHGGAGDDMDMGMDMAVAAHGTEANREFGREPASAAADGESAQEWQDRRVYTPPRSVDRRRRARPLPHNTAGRPRSAQPRAASSGGTKLTDLLEAAYGLSIADALRATEAKASAAKSKRPGVRRKKQSTRRHGGDHDGAQRRLNPGVQVPQPPTTAPRPQSAAPPRRLRRGRSRRVPASALASPYASSPRLTSKRRRSTSAKRRNRAKSKGSSHAGSDHEQMGGANTEVEAGEAEAYPERGTPQHATDDGAVGAAAEAWSHSMTNQYDSNSYTGGELGSTAPSANAAAMDPWPLHGFDSAVADGDTHGSAANPPPNHESFGFSGSQWSPTDHAAAAADTEAVYTADLSLDHNDEEHGESPGPLEEPSVYATATDLSDDELEENDIARDELHGGGAEDADVDAMDAPSVVSPHVSHSIDEDEGVYGAHRGTTHLVEEPAQDQDRQLEQHQPWSSGEVVDAGARTVNVRQQLATVAEESSG